MRQDYRTTRIVFLLACVVLAWPWISGSVTIPWDAKAEFWPQLVFLWKSLNAGDSPFWNPHIFAGHPQIADPQSLIFSPPYLLYALLSNGPTFAGADGVTFAMLALAGLAIISLFADRNWHPAGALVAALSFAFGGSNAWRIQHIGQVLSLCWFIIAFLFLTRALARRSIKDGILAGLCAGFMVIGRDQVAWLGTVLLVLYVVLWLVEGAGLGTRFRQSLAPLAGGLIAGVVTVAAPLAFTIALAEDSNRTFIDYAGAARGSLHPVSFMSLFVANLFGVDGPMRDYWGWPMTLIWGDNDVAMARNMTAVYLGAIPVIAFFAVGVPRGWLASREIRFALIAVLLMLLYALGGFTPAFRLMFAIPGADYFRRPADATFPLCAFLSIAGGWCVHRFLTSETKATRLEAVFGTALVITALLLAVFIAFVKGRLDQALPWIIIASASFAAATLALLAARHLHRRSYLAACAVLAVVMTFDLGFNNRPNESTGLPPQTYDALRLPSQTETVAVLNDLLAKEKRPDHRDRIELAAVDFHWPNAGLVHGWDHDLGYNPLRLKLFFEATGAIDQIAVPDQRRWSPLFPRYRSPLMDMLGVRYVASSVEPGVMDKAFQSGDLVPLPRTREAYLYENPRALPRVVFATQALPADFKDMLTTGAWPEADYTKTVLLEKIATSVPRPAGEAQIVSYRNTEILVEANSPEGGWLVLNDVWHPWWGVEVDGRDADMLRANVLFRAVSVPAGRHRIRFVFRPFAGVMARFWP